MDDAPLDGSMPSMSLTASLCSSFLQLTFNTSHVLIIKFWQECLPYPYSCLNFISNTICFLKRIWYMLACFTHIRLSAADVIEGIAVTGSYQTGQGWRGMGVLFGRRWWCERARAERGFIQHVGGSSLTAGKNSSLLEMVGMWGSLSCV